MKFGFSMPAVSALYMPPPYDFKNNNTINIVFKTTPNVLQEFVPPRLTPNPDNLAFFYVGELNVDSPVRLKYLEAGIGIPVLFDGRLGNYFVYLYLDTALPIVPGREIWGWPKKDAAISYSVEKNVVQATVMRDGIEIIRATVAASQRVDPVPGQADIPAFNLKIIPSVKRDQPPDVLQLTSATTISVTKELFKGEATLSFASSPNDQLGDISVLEIISGEHSVVDMRLDCGEVLVDYLAVNQP